MPRFDIQARLGWRLPTISVRASAVMFIALVAAALLAHQLTPRLTEVNDSVSLEASVPHQFGDWREVPSPYSQVRLTTGAELSTDQPYDQTVMRTYVNSSGQQVMLALAWGKRQRQEVKIHRPDLCYVAQGYRIAAQETIHFKGINGGLNPVIGKHMVAMDSRGGEAVAYWIRIGNLYSENALETRVHIFKQGLAGKVPDGILVRASARANSEPEVVKQFPVLEQFLVALYEASPAQARALMVRP